MLRHDRALIAVRKMRNSTHFLIKILLLSEITQLTASKNKKKIFKLFAIEMNF